MFIFAFIVGEEQDRSHPLIPYPLKFRLRPEAYLKLSPILLHHLIGTLRSHSIRVMSRPATFAGIKLESTILRLSSESVIIFAS